MLISVGIVFFLWFFVPPFRTGNFHIGSYTGTALSVAVLAYGILFDKINALISRIWRHFLGKCVLGLIVLVLVAILGLAVACMVAMGSGYNKSAPPKSTVVVLGCHVYPSGPSRTLRARLNSAYDYLIDNPDSCCIVCGGQGNNEPCTEASAMYEYLTDKGIDPARLFLEDTSTDTLENLRNARAIINENNLNPQVSIVTNDYHMYRALRYATSTGYENPGAISTPTLWWLFPGFYIREMYGILEMWILR